MVVNAQLLSKGIRALWRTQERIHPSEYSAFFLSTRGGKAGVGEVPTAFEWVPSSVDPSGASYGVGIGPIEHFAATGRWTIPLFFGLNRYPEPSVLDPYVRMPLFMDANGKVSDNDAIQPTVVRKFETPIVSHFPGNLLPNALFFAGNYINSMLLIGFFGGGLADILGAQSTSDTDASLLSLGPLAGMVLGQAISGAHLAIQHQDDDDAFEKAVRAVRRAWRHYESQSMNWAPADGWRQREGFAWESQDEVLRIWRPSIFVDPNIWSMHAKIDLIQDGKDDHIVIVASGRRGREGLHLGAMSAAANIAGVARTSFTIKRDDVPEGGNVFGAWAEGMLANVLGSKKQAAVTQMIELIGPGEKGLLRHLSHAERTF